MWLDTLNRMKKASGKTTDQIATESGVPKGTLNKLFAGQTKDPQYSTLKAVVHCLGFTVDDLDTQEAEGEKNSEVSNLTSEKDVEKTALLLQNVFESLGYIPRGGDMSDADLRFSMALVDMIDAYFNK